MVTSIKDLIPQIRTALSRAKVSLSDSADLESNRKEGGKYESCRKILQLQEKFLRVDLHTMKVTDDEIPDTPEEIGTRLFHKALEIVSSGRIMDDVMSSRVHVVPETGKNRLITVSHILHALVLHPISKICLEIISRLPSEFHGVKASQHAFNLYERLSTSNPGTDFVFDYEQIWALSSDLETATDCLSPERVKIMLLIILGKHCLGFPVGYVNVVVHLLTGSRCIYPSGNSGLPVQSERGCFMGDPMTKFVLHLVQLVAENSARLLYPHLSDHFLRNGEWTSRQAPEVFYLEVD